MIKKLELGVKYKPKKETGIEYIIFTNLPEENLQGRYSIHDTNGNDITVFFSKDIYSQKPFSLDDLELYEPDTPEGHTQPTEEQFVPKMGEEFEYLSPNDNGLWTKYVIRWMGDGFDYFLLASGNVYKPGKAQNYEDLVAKGKANWHATHGKRKVSMSEVEEKFGEPVEIIEE
jgi:hypothetical protein